MDILRDHFEKLFVYLFVVGVFVAPIAPLLFPMIFGLYRAYHQKPFTRRILITMAVIEVVLIGLAVWELLSGKIYFYLGRAS